MTADLSLNCREAKDDGRPLTAHVCTGCRDCECHHRPPPMPLRELIAATRRQEGTEPAEGA